MVGAAGAVDQARADAADVVVQVLDHGVVPGPEARPLPDPGHVGHVAPQAQRRRVEPGSTVAGIGGGDVGAVGRLHRQHGEERPVSGVAAVATGAAGRAAPSCAADVGTQMLDQQVAPRIGLVAGQPLRRLAVGAEGVALVLVVGGVVPHPVVKAAGGRVARSDRGRWCRPATCRRSVVAGGIEGVGHRGQPATADTRSPPRRSGASRQQRAAKRRAPRRPRHGAVEAHPLACQVVDIGRKHVAVAAVAGGVGAVLVAEDPHHVGPSRGTQGKPVTHACHLPSAGLDAEK